MQVISKILNVDNYDYYVKHLEMLNIIRPIDVYPEPLSEKEIQVLAAFMSQDKSLIDEDMFNGVVRKKVMDKLSLKPGGLGNHLKKMKEKGFLSKNEITKKITVNLIMPVPNGQGYRIMLKK